MRTEGPGLMLAAALLLPTAAAAQVDVGVKGGLSFGNISNKGVLPGDLQTRTGFAAGAAAAFRFRVIGIGAEALFAQRGVSDDDEVNEAKLDYLDIPVYLIVEAPTPGVAPFGYIGPQISFELRCRNVDLDCVEGDRSSTDYAGVVGAGLRFGDPDGLGLTAEARYVYGLKDLRLSTVTSDESYKTRSFLILAGIIF